MAFRGQGKWIEAPNVPYTTWQEPPTPNVPTTQFPTVNSGVVRDFDGDARWVQSNQSAVATVVTATATRMTRKVFAYRRQLMKERAEEASINQRFAEPPRGKPTMQELPENVRQENFARAPIGKPTNLPVPEKIRVEKAFGQPPQEPSTSKMLPPTAEVERAFGRPPQEPSVAGMAPPVTEVAKGSAFPAPIAGTEATKNKPPLVDPTLTPEQVRRRRLSGGY